jgi:hypothetical protein
VTQTSIALRFDRAETLTLAGLERVRINPPDFGRPALSDQGRTLAQNAWAERLRSEYIGVMVMRHFHGLCVDLNAPMDVQEAALAMTLQEQQHAALCADALTALGGEPELSFDVDELQFTRSQAPLEEQLIHMLVGTFVVGEVVALALIKHTLKVVPDSPFREVLKSIARDEVLHARIGSFTLAHIRSENTPKWMRWPGDDFVRQSVQRAQQTMAQRDVIDPTEHAAFKEEHLARELMACAVPPSQGFYAVHMEALQTDVADALAFMNSPG